MMSYSFTDEAVRDLDDIDRYLQTLPEASAKRIVLGLERAIQQIRRFPAIGRLDEKQTELAQTRVFRLLSEHYIIFYSVEQQHIRIYGVIHGKRDIDTIMSRRHE